MVWTWLVLIDLVRDIQCGNQDSENFGYFETCPCVNLLARAKGFKLNPVSGKFHTWTLVIPLERSQGSCCSDCILSLRKIKSIK